MNTKRLILSIVVVFVALFSTSFLIHEVWLKSDYMETMSLWRTPEEMQKHFAFLVLGHVLAAVAFVVIWSKGLSAVATLGGSCLYGLTMALFSEAGTLITYAVQPMPGSLMTKWFIAGIVQGVLMGVVVFLVGKPKSQA
jgi:hypothetical protein